MTAPRARTDQMIEEAIGPVIPYFSGSKMFEAFVVHEHVRLRAHVKDMGKHSFLLTEEHPGHFFMGAAPLVIVIGDLVAEVVSGSGSTVNGVRCITWQLYDNTRAAKAVRAALKAWHE